MSEDVAGRGGAVPCLVAQYIKSHRGPSRSNSASAHHQPLSCNLLWLPPKKLNAFPVFSLYPVHMSIIAQLS
jgi:hypothetical protein